MTPLTVYRRNVAASLHQSAGFKFKSLIGRFRISYTEEDHIRELLLPAQTKLWSSIGPFPAEDVTKAFATRMPNARSEPMTNRREIKGEISRVSASPSSGSGSLRLPSGIPPVLERDFGSKSMDLSSILKTRDRRRRGSLWLMILREPTGKKS